MKLLRVGEVGHETIAAKVPKIVDKAIVIKAKPKLKRKAERNSSLLKKANIHLSEIPSGGNVK